MPNLFNNALDMETNQVYELLTRDVDNLMPWGAE
jgi:hypothetical protein